MSQLGTTTARARIQQAFNDGASLVSFLGHGGIALWASENLFNIWDVPGLKAPQPQQPFLLTINCMNGFFTFPYFDSLSEELLKAEGKGVVAAFSSSGLSLHDPAQRYLQAIVHSLGSERYERLGDAMLAAQGRYIRTGGTPELLSLYHLFGDPALRIK